MRIERHRPMSPPSSSTPGEPQYSVKAKNRTAMHPFAFVVERCADVIVSTAARRSILAGGGAPPVPKNLRRRPKNIFQKIHEKFPSIINRKLQQNKYTAKMASAARRQIIGDGAPINKSRRRQRRPQIVGGAAGARL